MANWLRDLKWAARSLIKSPGFTVVAVLCLALGIGATCAIFSLINSILLKPLPYGEADRVVTVYNRFAQQGGDRLGTSGHEFIDLRDRTRSFDSVAAVVPQYYNLTGRDEPLRLTGARASWNTFSLLGVQPIAGRTFREEEDVFGQNGYTILGYDFFREQFGGGDPKAALGTVFSLNNRPFEVIGVLPEDFRFGAINFDLWVPIAINLGRLPPRSARGLTTIARLAPEVAIDEAQLELDSLAGRLMEEYPQFYSADSGYRLDLVSVRDDLVGNIRPRLLMVFFAVALVLVIACANVANLLLARATAREKEVAIRTALGAGRWRLTRQFLAESLLLTTVASALGLLLAAAGLKLLLAMSPGGIPRLSDVSIDGTVVLFAVGLALATGVIFGLVPALRSSSDRLHEVLKEGGKTSASGARGGGARSALMAAEIALALVVLIGAALMLGSFRQLQDVDPGFETEGLLTSRVFLSPARYPDSEQRAAFFRDLTGRLDAIPGVESAAAISHLPLGPIPTPTGAIEVDRQARNSGDPTVNVGWSVVVPGYFETMGIPLQRGRFFDRAAEVGQRREVIIDRELADRLFPNEDPTDRRQVRVERFAGMSEWCRVIGVVGNVRSAGLNQPSDGQVYFAHDEYPYLLMSTVMRTSNDPSNLTGPLREAVWAGDPNQPVLDVQPMSFYLDAGLARDRWNATLLGLFSAVALILALIGVYGIMAYGVLQRTQEIGVRMALGAQRGQILGLIMRRGLTIAAIGLVIGLAVSFALTRLMSGVLYGISATDLTSYLVVTLILALAAVIATGIPALRATRVDPNEALRYE